MANHAVVKEFRATLCLDGSEHADAAVQLLSHIPVPQNNLITIVAVFSPRQLEKHSVLTDVLMNAKNILTDQGWNVETELKAGYPAETIMEIAELKNSQMITLGAVGLRATLGILLGGVAQQIVEYGKWPVLVVRSPLKSLNKILLAMDGSECSKIASQYLLNFPLPTTTEVHIVHVLPPLPAASMVATSMVGSVEPIPPVLPLPSTAELETWEEDEKRRGENIIGQGQAILSKKGLKVHKKILRGDAATEIIDYAHREQIALIVAGSRGLSTISSWLLGSVSRKLIHYSGCSVLIVRSAK